MKSIIGIGNALLDSIINVDDSILEELHLEKGSMSLIDENTHNDILKKTSGVEKKCVSGGSASNCIHAIAHLGVPTVFQGKIGRDEQGKLFKEDCEKVGMKTHFTINEHLCSGVANTFITKDSERTFATFLGAASTLSEDDIIPDIMKECSILHTEGYLVQDPKMFRKMMETAKQEGVKVSLDCGSFNVINGAKDFFDEIIPKYVDILFCNEQESEALTGISDPEESLRKLAEIVELPVVKLGKNGSILLVNDEIKYIPAYKVDKVIDTTGAGDMYAGTFLAGYVRGFPLEKCAKAASYSSALLVQCIGAKLTDEQWETISPKIEAIFNEKV